jgi:poly(3-hydroxybutyrate) depolymerase
MGWHRTTLKIIAGTAVVLVATAAVMLGPYAFRVRHVEADSAQGYSADFYLYLSPSARRLAESGEPVTILVQPNNSGITSDDVARHRRDAWWMGFGRHGLADELGVALLVPAFVRPATDWEVYTHALDRDVMTTARPDLARVDLQLLAMLNHARAMLAADGFMLRERVLLQGYSASGMFANRFTALHPRRVLAVAAGSPGGWPIAPIATYDGEPLPYPAGVADLELLTGDPFDSIAYGAVPQLIVMGTLDDNDGLDYGDGWDSTAAATVDRLFGATPMARWQVAETIYQSAGADAQFVLVDGIGHDRKALQPLSTAFLKEQLARVREDGP